jgi:quinol monooxygenase YgiN
VPEPVIAVASFEPLPGRTDDVIEALRPIMAQIQQEPGCLLYALHASDDGRIHFIEKWETKADADRHGTESPAMALLAEHVSPLLNMASMSFTEMRPVPTGDPERGTL